MSWFERRVDSYGSVLYRSAYAPSLSAIPELVGSEVKVEERPAGPDNRWVLRLTDPELGVATVVSSKTLPLPPPEVLAWDRHLQDADREAIGKAGSALAITVEGRRSHVLRDRKLALRFMQRLLGRDGIAAADHAAMRFWTRGDLEDELQHDADLDIESLYTVHCVSNEECAIHGGGDEGGVAEAVWLHTHGLAELGGFDFDVLRPSADVLGRCADLLRALAFRIVEGARPGERITILPGEDLALVPVAEFETAADPGQVSLRDDPDGSHRDSRVILCDPGRRGIFRKSRPSPSRLLSTPFPDDGLIQFSTASSMLMAERARKTYGVLRRAFAELQAVGLPVLAKIGYVVDGGGDTDLEHLWFEVHALEEEALDATLVNEPFQIARMKEGDRGRHPVGQLTDWMVMTPAGPVTPRSLFLLRWIHDHFDELRKAMAEAAKSG